MMEVEKVEKIIRYACKDCKKEHETEYKCVACEDSHKHPVSVSRSMKFFGTYPKEIDVLMSNGKTKRYKWSDEYDRYS